MKERLSFALVTASLAILLGVTLRSCETYQFDRTLERLPPLHSLYKFDGDFTTLEAVQVQAHTESIS